VLLADPVGLQPRGRHSRHVSRSPRSPQMTTQTPITADVGTFLAQMGAVNVVDQYRAGTLPPSIRRFVDLTIRQCEQQGDNAKRWVDGVVALTVREWAEAQAADDSV